MVGFVLSIGGGARVGKAAVSSQVRGSRFAKRSVLRAKEAEVELKEEAAVESKEEAAVEVTEKKEEAAAEEIVSLVGLSKEEEEQKREILSQLEEEREEYQKVILPNNRNLGATRDADGKSNIWAVEPPVVVESEEQQSNKGAIIAACVALIVLGMASLPFLPLISPDAY
eukprot:CAMPEP_0113959608 /NCGR_PEP_ID=MMETSP0011_2-20120614/4242_1 /TAXON_ID=101924 /ORGANISM="Rhodosorus marinus" /LENGTH=169 /DNA_ID=CAMNT_0000970945 /DNA_START=87 /DNA_END=596 /DNA_ORIENTATION=- /assembly_acc=CAM_ASM_000156